MNTAPSTNQIAGDASKVTTNPDASGDVYAPTTTIPVVRSENDQQTTQNSTVFADGGTAVEGFTLPTANSSNAMLARNLSLSNQSILDFFAKPQWITNVPWTTSDAQFHLLYRASLPWAIFSATAALASKMAYFASFKGDIIVSIQANPAMAASGKLIIAYEPFKAVFGSTANYTIRERSGVTLTQLPHIQMDLATDREAQFRIPWRVPLAFLPVPAHASWMDIGDLVIYVYAPLRSSALTQIPLNIWMWFDPDTVVLANPTTNATVPTRALGRVQKQAGGLVRNNGRGGMEAEKSTAPVSSILGKVATVATTLAAVPVLTEIAAPVAWVAGVAAGVASALGYSNPRQESAPILVYDRSSRDACTVDQSIPGFVYAFTGDAKVQKVPPGGLVSEDEMHFGHLLPMSTYFSTVVWSTSQTSDTVLVHDLKIGTGLGKSTDGTWDFYTPWRACLGMFKYWRGNIRITIKISKTRFHSGRLVAFFDAYPSQTHSSIDGSEVLPRLIMDMESGNEWTFEFPFPSQTLYNSVDDQVGVGTFNLFVMTPLNSCGSAATSVDIVLETSMRADASFMYPGGIVWQVGGTLPNQQNAALALTNMSMSEFKDPVDIEGACVGDFCRTLRSLVKRPLWYSADGVGILMNTPNNQYNALLDRISQWYALCRGTTRLSLLSTTPGVVYLAAPITQSDAIPTTSSQYFQLVPANVVVDLEVPQMAVMPWRYNTYAVPDTTQAIFKYPCLIGSGLSDPVLAAVSAADDFDLALFIGVFPDLHSAEAPQPRSDNTLSFFRMKG